MIPALAAALIVKDEADTLGECLESLARFVDEVCVVDTGSTDGTPDIAARLGATVASQIWNNDFSEARNRALELCKADWILVVDADERVAPGDGKALRSLIAGSRNVAYRFVTRNYTNQTNLSEFTSCERDDPWARGFAGWFPSAKVRLFPNRRKVRFEGKVHELVNGSLSRQSITIVDSSIPIHHYPLLKDAARVRRKQELYVALGQAKAAENPSDPKVHTELGDQLVELGDLSGALLSYRTALRLCPHDAAVLRSIGAVLHLMNRGAEAEKALRLSLRHDGASADAWRNLGVVLASLNEWREAGDCFAQALTLKPEWNDGHRYLGLALAHQGRSLEAATAAGKALRAASGRAEVVQGYLDIMRLCQRTDEAYVTLRELGIPLPQ